MRIDPIFTIDWEPVFAYRPYSTYWELQDPMVKEPTYYLLDLLDRHGIKAIWYCVGWLKDRERALFKAIVKKGHVIGDHTYYHKLEDRIQNTLFRSPKFKGEKRLYSGGFWFRALPYQVSKALLDQSRIFYIHPHDLLLDHPPTGSVTQDLKRSIGTSTVKDKLERLCREVKFTNADTIH